MRQGVEGEWCSERAILLFLQLNATNKLADSVLGNFDGRIWLVCERRSAIWPWPGRPGGSQRRSTKIFGVVRTDKRQSEPSGGLRRPNPPGAGEGHRFDGRTEALDCARC